MFVNEADPLKRTIKAHLTVGGAPLPANHVFAVGDLKLVQPDDTVATAAALPVAVAGADAGSFDIVIAQAELQQAGTLRAQLLGAGVDFWEWLELVEVPASATVDTNALAAAVVAQITALGGLAVTAVRFSPPVTGIASYDVGDLEPPMRITVPFDGTHADLTTATSVTLRWTKPDGTKTSVPLAIVDTLQRVVQRVWAAGDTDQAGVHSGEVVITWPGGRVQTLQTIYNWTVRATL